MGKKKKSLPKVEGEKLAVEPAKEELKQEPKPEKKERVFDHGKVESDLQEHSKFSKFKGESK